MKMLIRTLVVSVFCLFVLQTAGAAPIGTSFTYQGELNYQGQPANGSFNFQFSLWDSIEDGEMFPSGQGLILFRDEVPVVNGVFTVELDFGTDIHTNQLVWLQIEVQHPDLFAEPPVVLSPRQALRPAPFALSAGHVVNLTSSQCDDRSYLVGFGPNNELICRSATALHCGDGQVTPPEDCDDGNQVDGDGCSSDCKLPPLLVFLTSETFFASAVSGGLDPITGADSTCQGLADAAGLEGVFKAWISTCAWNGAGYDCISPATHWDGHGFPLARVDGVRVANSLLDIFNRGELLAPINRDEYGEPSGVAGWVFTGTDEYGLDPRSFSSEPGQTWCDEWTSTDGAFLSGNYEATDSTWSNDGLVPCAVQASMYCFQQP